MNQNVPQNLSVVLRDHLIVMLVLALIIALRALLTQ